MAHDLNFNEQTGQHSFFSVQQKAWHGLGQMVQDYPTSSEAIAFAGLNYTVEKLPLFTLDQPNMQQSQQTRENGCIEAVQPSIVVPDYYATVRTDSNQVLGVVGNDYEVVQNTDAFTFFDSIIGGAGIQYETAGALGNGERIFITAKLPDYIQVGNDDLIDKYLFLTTSHNGYGSIIAAFTPTRIVCNNTLHMALSNRTNAVKIRHTGNAKERLSQAHQVMGITNMLSAQLEGMFNQWARVRITDQQVKKLIQLAMVPNKEVLRNIEAGKDDALSSCFKNMVNTVYEYGLSSPTQQSDTTRGTVFGAYNAVTGYFQNVRKYKDDECKLKSVLLGGTAQLRSQAAFALCNDFAAHGKQALQLN